MPNKDLRSDSSDWLQYVISVEDIENNLNTNLSVKYDFFSEIKNQKTRDLLRKNTTVKLAASLMADNGLSNTDLLVADTSVWHDGVIKTDTTPINSFNKGISQVSLSQLVGTNNSVSQVSTSQIGVEQIDFTQVGIPQNSTSEIGISQTTILQHGISQNSTSQISSIHAGVEFSTSQIGIGQIGIAQNSSVQVSTSKIGSTQISTIQANGFQPSLRQVGSTQIASREISNPKFDESQINFTQVGINESIFVESRNLNSLKVSFSSGISSQQFFGSNINSLFSFNDIGVNNQPIIIHNAISNVFSTASRVGIAHRPFLT
jgi:hypothetical protein